MNPVVAVHVAAGGVALVAGFIALFAMKGVAVHRKTGIVFVYAMVVMGVLGSAVAAAGGGEVSTVAGLLPRTWWLRRSRRFVPRLQAHIGSTWRG